MPPSSRRALVLAAIGLAACANAPARADDKATAAQVLAKLRAP